MEEQEQVGEGQAVVDESKEIDYAAELKALKEAQSEYEARFAKQEELLKKRDSTISKLSKEKEQAEMEKLSEAERAEAEKQKAIKEAEEIKAETAKLRRDRDLAKVLYESGLDADKFGKRISGETEEEMKADAEVLKAEIKAAVDAGIEAEINRRFGGDGPKDTGREKKDLSYAEQLNRAAAISSGKRVY